MRDHAEEARARAEAAWNHAAPTKRHQCGQLAGVTALGTLALALTTAGALLAIHAAGNWENR